MKNIVTTLIGFGFADVAISPAVIWGQIIGAAGSFMYTWVQFSARGTQLVQDKGQPITVVIPLKDKSDHGQ